MAEKLRKKLFYVTAIVNFIMVAVYEFLTPTMSDDVIYADKVAEATSFFDLFAQEYEHYMGHTGRSISHIMLRIFLYIGNKAVFNVAAALVFTALSLMIYANIRHKRAYDLRIYVGILVLMWLFDPTISNSTFWETGACNYMFTAAIMFAFITVYRKAFWNDRDSGIGFAIGVFLLGVLAGWCNENTSGGVIVFSLLMLIGKWFEKRDFSGFKNWMVTGVVGNIVGYLVMLLSPGNTARAGVEAEEEAHTGILALAARFLKITLNIKESYLVLVFVFMVVAIAIAYRTGKAAAFFEASKGMLLFGFMFLATCYALIMVSQSQLRTYYGASLFLMTGIMQGIAWIVNEGFKEDVVQILVTSIVAIYGVFLLFTYVQEGANLARIKREFDEREVYYIQCVQEDKLWIKAPKLRPQWQSRFSMAYDSDISEDKDNWLNMSYCYHYGLDFIEAVEREDWTEY
ncbi:DUF3329 domain-containing protein [Butyrivibrio sp. AE2032]|uniref:DUF3329 domain-containing protein n=1 Tax=Butyrivibrio sp. AE2032 TaxID=1458463 RepID=UPI0005570EB1|nr:DUF6056 family protein [Butyrivibrio sp. AE2032]